MDHGYEPAFKSDALSALFSGFNLANQDQTAQEELIKAFLANQRETAMQPLDTKVKQYEADLAEAKRLSPTYIDKSLKGYEGQMNSQIAAGKEALKTVDGKIKRKELEDSNAATRESLMERLLGSQMGRLGKPQGTIAFPMAPAEQQLTSGFNWQAPQTSVAGSPQQPNANNSPIVPSPPTRNGGITQGTLEEEQIMQILMNTPEFRQKLITGDQRFDSAEWAKFMDYQARMAAIDAAKARGNQNGVDKPPKTFEELVARLQWKSSQGLALTESELTALAEGAAGFNAKNAAKIQPGLTLNPNIAPGTLEKKPDQVQYKPGNAKPTDSLQSQVEASGEKYEPDKYEYRSLNGKVQKRLKEK